MKDYTFIVKKNAQVASGVYAMDMECAEPLPPIKAGQFVNVEVGRRDLILRRPFCVYDYSGRVISIVYAVVGKGTEDLASARAGDCLRVLLPLGNGFDLSAHGRAVFLGGGIGCAALNLLVRESRAKVKTSYLGFSNAENAKIFEKGFREHSDVVLCTDDGSMGQKQFPTVLLERELQEGARPDMLYVCGPHKMLLAAKSLADKYDIPAVFSGESRMGCGYGVCLVCACKVDGENLRACKDGPVFDLRRAVL